MSNKSHVFVAMAASGFLLAGCETTDRLNIDDGHAPLLSGAVVVRPSTWQFDSHDRFKGGVEFGYERQLAENWQRIDSGHNVTIQNPDDTALSDYRFSGPQKVHNRVRVEHGHVLFKPLLSLGSHFQFEPALGLGYDEFTITTAGQARLPTVGPATVETHIESWNANVGVTPRFKFDQFTAIEAQARFGLGKDGDSSLISAAVVLTPFKQLEIRGGYAWRRQEIEMPESISNIRLQTDGPAVGLRFVF